MHRLARDLRVRRCIFLSYSTRPAAYYEAGDEMKTKKNAGTYARFILLSLAVGGAASVVTMKGMPLYDQMAKPWFAPPDLVFPVVWTLLYVLMGIGMARVWLTKLPVRKGALVVFLIQLAVNFLWTVWFFGLHKYLLAFLWLVLLVFVVAEMSRWFSLADKVAGRLQIPYLLWGLFATALNLAVWLLNR